MSTAILEPISTLNLEVAESIVVNTTATGELVGGNSAELTSRVAPMVHDGNVALDLKDVKRIDAAGIAALVALYRSAREAGHRFSLTNVPARVANILALVGLENLLVSHNAVRNSHSAARRQRSAA